MRQTLSHIHTFSPTIHTHMGPSPNSCVGVCVGVVCVSSNLPIVFFLEEEEFAEDEKLSDRHDFLN